MKKTIVIIAAIILVATSCKKDPVLIDRTVIVKAIVLDGKKSDGRTYWKPGITFNKGINATGTATVRWFYGGRIGSPYATYTQVLNWTVTTSQPSYTMLSDYKLPDLSFYADSARIIEFNLSSGDYNVTIDNN